MNEYEPIFEALDRALLKYLVVLCFAIVILTLGQWFVAWLRRRWAFDDEAWRRRSVSSRYACRGGSCGWTGHPDGPTSICPRCGSNYLERV